MSTEQQAESLNVYNVPVCPDCGSENISLEAPVYWNKFTAEWECYDPYDKSGFCSDCQHEIRYADWIKVPA